MENEKKMILEMLQEMKTEMNQRFDAMDKRFDGLEKEVKELRVEVTEFKQLSTEGHV